MIKRCAICGAKFKAYPSDKIVTCSPECRSERARRAALERGNIFLDPENLRKLAESPKRKAHVKEMQIMGKNAAMELPGNQKGIENRTGKLWILIDPTGNKHAAINLLQFIRDNAELFDIMPDDEKSIRRISYGFRAISRTLSGTNSGRPVYHCHDWGLDCPSLDFPDKYSSYKCQNILNLWLSGLDVESISQKTQFEKSFIADVLESANLIKKQNGGKNE